MVIEGRLGFSIAAAKSQLLIITEAGQSQQESAAATCAVGCSGTQAIADSSQLVTTDFAARKGAAIISKAQPVGSTYFASGGLAGTDAVWYCTKHGG